MRRISSLIIAAVVALAGAGVASADYQEDYQAGVAAFKAGDFKAAAQEFSAVVEAKPEYDGGHIMLAQSLRKLGRHEDALVHFRKAYELKPDQLSYQLALSQGYVAVNRHADAAQMLQKIDPSALPKGQQDEYHQMLAGALDKSGDSGAALASLKKLTELNPNDADAWYIYGAAAFSVDTDASVAALEKAVALDGNDPRKREALAKALVRQASETNGDRQKAIYDKAVRVAGELATAEPSFDNVLRLGELQLGAASYRDAAVTLKKAAAANASHWLPHYYLAQAYTLLGDYDNANASAEAALGKASSEKERQMVWKRIGFAREKLRDYEGAKEAYIKGGDPQSAARVDENKRIAGENQQIEAENQQIQEMEAERRRLEEELRELGGPPRR